MRAVWLVLLLGFASLNAYALVVGDLAGLQAYLASLGPWGTLATVDLLIALFVSLAFIWRDANARDVNPLPYVVVTLLTGSIGILIYLFRFWEPTAERGQPQAPAA